MAKDYVRGLILSILIISAFCEKTDGQDPPTVFLESEPAGANVLINDKLKGITPYNYIYNLDDGKRLDIRMEMPEHQGMRITIKPEEKKES